MSNLLKLFNEARPLLELQASFTTFRVTSGFWKNRILIIISVITTLLVIFLTAKNIQLRFDGEINMNIMMSALVCVGSSQSPLKSICGMIKRKLFYKCLEEIEESYCNQEDDEELNQIAEKHLMSGLQIWKVVYIWFTRLLMVGITFLCLQMRLSESIGLVMDCSFLPSLPSDSIFWNEILYLLQLFLLLIIGISLGATDITIIFIGLQIMVSLDILNDYIKLINVKIKTNPKFLKTNLKRHSKVIDQINLLNDAISEISFIQMIINTLGMMLVFVLIRKGTMWVAALTSCFCAMSQIFILCAFGEMIKIKTEELSTTLYLTNWYELSVKEQKTFLIILGMAQRDYGLKAAGMYVVDIYTFIQVVKLAGSYCAILYTLSK